jgi:AhpD family alkylhydroperoxidase
MEQMTKRFLMGKVLPDAYRSLLGLESFTRSSDIPLIHRELINIRASQINGCAYCVDAHSKEARKHGETEERIYLISVWREAPNIFNDEEQLLLEMTEEITLIHKHGLSDRLYDKAISLWGEKRTAQVMMAIININSYNRIGVGTTLHPVKEKDNTVK